MSDGAAPDAAAIERRLDVHGMLIRALLTHLAYADSEALRSIVAGFSRSAAQHPGGAAEEAAGLMTALLEDMAGSLHHR